MERALFHGRLVLFTNLDLRPTDKLTATIIPQVDQYLILLEAKVTNLDEKSLEQYVTDHPVHQFYFFIGNFAKVRKQLAYVISLFSGRKYQEEEITDNWFHQQFEQETLPDLSFSLGNLEVFTRDTFPVKQDRVKIQQFSFDTFKLSYYTECKFFSETYNYLSLIKELKELNTDKCSLVIVELRRAQNLASMLLAVHCDKDYPARAFALEFEKAVNSTKKISFSLFDGRIHVKSKNIDYDQHFYAEFAKITAEEGNNFRFSCTGLTKVVPALALDPLLPTFSYRYLILVDPGVSFGSWQFEVVKHLLKKLAGINESEANAMILKGLQRKPGFLDGRLVVSNDCPDGYTFINPNGTNLFHLIRMIDHLNSDTVCLAPSADRTTNEELIGRIVDRIYHLDAVKATKAIIAQL